MKAARKNLEKREEAGEELLARLKTLAGGGRWSLLLEGGGRWRGEVWWWVEERGKGVRWPLLECEGVPYAWEQMDYPIIEGDGRDAILPPHWTTGVVLEAVHAAVKRDIGNTLLEVAFDVLEDVEPFAPASLTGDQAWDAWKELEERIDPHGEGFRDREPLHRLALRHLLGALEEVF